MNSEKLVAKIETREYFFRISDQKPEALSIVMYNSSYTFVKKNGQWRNQESNKANASQELIDAVILAV